jgi:hypothetical protein
LNFHGTVFPQNKKLKTLGATAWCLACQRLSCTI